MAQSLKRGRGLDTKRVIPKTLNWQHCDHPAWHHGVVPELMGPLSVYYDGVRHIAYARTSVSNWAHVNCQEVLPWNDVQSQVKQLNPLTPTPPAEVHWVLSNLSLY